MINKLHCPISRKILDWSIGHDLGCVYLPFEVGSGVVPFRAKKREKYV